MELKVISGEIVKENLVHIKNVPGFVAFPFTLEVVLHEEGYEDSSYRLVGGWWCAPLKDFLNYFGIPDETIEKIMKTYEESIEKAKEMLGREITGLDLENLTLSGKTIIYPAFFSPDGEIVFEGQEALDHIEAISRGFRQKVRR